MPFAPPHEEVFEEAVKPACEATGFECLRADYPLKAGSIIEHTIELIFEVDVLLADLSGSNANVFYELGVAHALDKHTIMICEQGAQLPFNVSTYRVIFYKRSVKGIQAELRSTLVSILEDIESWASTRAINPVQVIRLLRQIEQSRGELEQHVRRLEEESQRHPKLLEFILPDIELKHLRSLGGNGEFRYSKQHTFLEELRHLRWVGLIENKPGVAIGGIPDEGNLKDYLRVSEKGRRFLDYIEGKRKKPNNEDS
jgi:nucleoside 2-deoxyribosyltransferase